MTAPTAPLILIVDDEPSTSSMLAITMQGEGYQVEIADNGRQALELYSRLKPALILLDIMMPGLNGFEVCRIIREMPGGERSAIVVLTALQDNRNIRLIFEVGASDYIAKPFNMVELKQRVRRLLYTTQIEHELWEAKEKYTALFERSLDGVIITDFEGRVLEANQAALTMLEISAAALPQKSIWDWVLPGQIALLQSCYQQALEQGSSPPTELELRSANGGQLFVEITAALILQDQRPWALQGVMRNITERKRMEQVLKKSENRYRSLFEDSPISIWEADFSEVQQFVAQMHQQGVEDVPHYLQQHPAELRRCIEAIRILDVNQATLQLYQAGTKGDMFESLERIYNLDVLTDFSNILTPLLRGETLVKIETQHQTMLGQQLYIVVWLALVPGYEETWEKMIISILDITEIHRSTEMIRRRETIMEAVSIVASQFLKNDNWQDRLEDALAVLGKAIDVHRICFFDYDSSSVTGICQKQYEWVNPELDSAIQARIAAFDEFPIATHPRWLDMLRERQVVYERLENLPPEEQASLHPFHLTGLIIVPVFVEISLWGFLLIVDHGRERTWTSIERDALRLAADTLGGAIHRTRILVAEREQRLFAEALSDINTSITSTLDIDQLLDRILNHAAYLVPYETGYVAFVEGERWEVVRERGYEGYALEQRSINRGPRQNSEFENIQRMISQREAILIKDVQMDKLWHHKVYSSWIKSFIAAPIILEEEVIGFIGLNSTIANFYNEQHLTQLQALTNSAAIALKNVRSFEQAQQLATLEERQRIARDLHDAVTQTIFSASTIAAALPRLLDSEPELVRKNLYTLGRLTRGALAELRILLHELRPNSLMSTSLLILLTQLAESVQGRTQIKCVFMADGDPDMPKPVKVLFYRIAQEAVHNAVKHSMAQKIMLQLSSNETRVMLQVVDDGRGFDPQQVKADRMGLHIMQERAAEHQAALHVRSHRGQGTEIMLSWKMPSDVKVIEAEK